MSIEDAVQQNNAPGGVVAMENPLMAAAQVAGVHKRNEIAMMLHPGN